MICSQLIIVLWQEHQEVIIVISVVYTLYWKLQ